MQNNRGNVGKKKNKKEARNIQNKQQMVDLNTTIVT